MKTQKLMFIITCLLSFIFSNVSYAGQYREIISKRTAYSKTFYSGNGQYKTVISLRPIHLETPDGYFKEIDLSSRSDTLSYLNFTGIYKEYVNSIYTYIATGFSYVGNMSIDDTTEQRYRSAQYWDVQGISDNVTIDSAKFQLDISYYLSESMTINLKDLDYIYPGNLIDIYNDCSSGTTLGTLDLPEHNGHFDTTFSSGSSFCQNLKNSLTKDWFGIGFYTSSETVSGKHAQLGTSDGYLEVFYYNPSVPFEVIVNNEFSGGFYKLIFYGDTVQHNVPDTLYMFHGDQPGLMAVNQQYGNYFRVFHYWLEEPGNNQYASNPLYITINQNASYEWKTRRRFEVNLDNEYLNGGSGGYILVNGDSLNVPHLQYVLESDSIILEAPSQSIEVNDKAIQYNLLKWGDGSTSNPRLFFPPDNINIIAKYKGHLVSDESNATAENNQRKMVRGSPGSHNAYMVYEDNGGIYFTVSYNDGSQWEPEIRLSEGEGNNYYPSIAINEPGDLAVVWEQHDTSYDFIWLVFKMYHSGQWKRSRKDIPVQNAAFNFPATAVVASLGPTNYGAPDAQMWLFVWRDYPERVINYAKTDYQGDYIDYGQVPGSGGYGNASNPTIGSGMEFHLGDGVYVAFSYYYYIRTVLLFWNGSSWSWETIRNLYFASSGKPQAAADGAHNIHFGWQAGYSSYAGTYLVHQEVNTINGEWSDVFTYYNRQGIKSVNVTGHFNYGTDPEEKNGTTIFWQNNQNNIYALQNINGNWGKNPVFLLNNTTFPNSSKIAPKNNIPYVSTSETSAPYLLSTSILNLEESGEDITIPALTTRWEPKHYRGFHFLNDSLLFIFFEIGDIKLLDNITSVMVPFSGNGSQLPHLLASTSALNFLQSAQVIIPRQAEGISYNLNGWIENAGRFLTRSSLNVKIALYDAATNNLISVLDSLNFVEGQMYSYSSRVINLNTYIPRNRPVYLGVGLGNIRNNALKEFKSNVINIYHLENDSIPSEKLLSSQTGTADLGEIPRSFAFYPNFPNPFNPTTNLSFDLPKESKVILTIYDVTGRRIKTLISSQYPAGFHQVQWDGRDDSGNAVASGIYVYRIEAGKYTQSRKMMLLK